MDEVTINNILYDYYGELLTDMEKSHFEDYYFHNLTLAEIAKSHNLSRNAVHKAINSAVKKLHNFEEKLKLNHKSKQIKKLMKENNITGKDFIKEIEELI